MSLEKILTKVEADSKAAEQKILGEAKRKKDEQLAEAGKRREAILADFKAKADKAVQQLRTRETAGLEMERKKRNLGARKKVLDLAFDRVLEHFASLPANEKSKLYRGMMAAASKEMAGGRVLCVKGEERMFPSKPGFTVSAGLTGAGGFVLESQDGKTQVDMRFEVLLKDLWDKHLGQVSEMLFGGQG